MLEETYYEARRPAEHIAAKSDPPLFYKHKENEVGASRKKYGPDFIARGLDIGRKLFGELQERYVAEG